ncbi:MAG: hypothetical protein AB1646_12815 [Thermodesulfobacteriota bacterium]
MNCSTIAAQVKTRTGSAVLHEYAQCNGPTGYEYGMEWAPELLLWLQIGN